MPKKAQAVVLTACVAIKFNSIQFNSSKRYREQRLKVPPRTVDLLARGNARRRCEREHLAAVTATLRHACRLPPSLQMQAPVAGQRSALFQAAARG